MNVITGGILLQDGHFVPNLTIGAPVLKALRRHTDAYLDVHLMVSNPAQWVDDFAAAGTSGLTFHVEAVKPGAAGLGWGSSFAASLAHAA